MAYTPHRLWVLQVVTIVSCSTSIVFCLVAIYAFLAIHPRRRLFRHQLIVLLIFTDLVKAIFILLYPALILSGHTISPQGENGLGWLTAFSIEAGDLAILSFAIHTLLTIFNPHRAGGLLFLRSYVLCSCLLIPVLLASLAFVNGVGYTSFDVYCYLPVRPLWYRFVLSWGPRYAIMLAILVIYCTIYFYVSNELRHMERQSMGLGEEKRNFAWTMDKIMLFIKTGNTEEREQPQDIIAELTSHTNQRLAARYRTIAKQMKIVFLYPIAYFLLWIFPMVQNSIRIEQVPLNYPVACIVSFTQAFNGVVDTLVFLYREKPWRLTVSNTPVVPDLGLSQWRKSLQWAPLFHIPRQHLVEPQVISLKLEPEEFASDSHGVDYTKRAPSTEEEEEKEDDDDMDFVAFLKRGPV